MPTALACVNGTWTPIDKARVPIQDRGFLFGDGVYEVLRVYAGQPWLEGPHFARFARSLREMAIAGVDLDAIRGRSREAIARSGLDEATVYLQITRGSAARSHAFPRPAVTPTEVITIQPYDDTATAALRERGGAAIFHDDLRWGRCDIKSVNLLGNVLALEKAKQAETQEAILIDRAGHVTEATHSSLLWVRDGVLEGTPEGPAILPGTTRHFVLDLAKGLGIPYREARVTPDELRAADEVILAGTTFEVLGVTTIEGQPIGRGRVGPVTARLRDAFRNAVREACLATA